AHRSTMSAGALNATWPALSSKTCQLNVPVRTRRAGAAPDWPPAKMALMGAVPTVNSVEVMPSKLVVSSSCARAGSAGSARPAARNRMRMGYLSVLCFRSDSAPPARSAAALPERMFRGQRGIAIERLASDFATSRVRAAHGPRRGGPAPLRRAARFSDLSKTDPDPRKQARVRAVELEALRSACRHHPLDRDAVPRHDFHAGAWLPRRPHDDVAGERRLIAEARVPSRRGGEAQQGGRRGLEARL